MVYKPLSEAVKLQKTRAQYNARMRRAIDEYKQQELKPKNLRLSYQTVADLHKVSKSTLQRLVTGGVSMSAFNAGKQRLTPAEERVVVDFCLESADRGFPLTHDNVYKCADNILSARLGSEHDSLGLNWVDTFLIRHHDELQTHWSKPLDTQRGRALNPTNVKLWFDLLKENIADKNIFPHNIYGMDESGFPPSDQGTQRVIGRRGTKTQHKQGSAERENVTAIVTICADGTVLQPTIIFKGQNFMRKWGDNNVASASISHSANGWTDGDLALEWMVEDFDRQTKDKAAGETRVLLMDGHSSHYTPELLDFTRSNNIIILGYPPHCTHALQGLDVVCFARMKEAWKEEIHKFEELHRTKVTKGDFTEVFGKAFLKAFTEDTIYSAFEKTGVYPFNPEVITEQQMKTSEPTSTIGSLPIPLPSPVRAIMAVFNHRNLTAFDISVDTHTHNPEPSHPHDPELRLNALDSAVDPSLFTPTKRMRIMAGALAGTSTGSFVIDKPRITSAQVIGSPVFERPAIIPDPDWSLLQQPPTGSSQTKTELKEQIAKLTLSLNLLRQQIAAKNSAIEGANAQLAVQAVYNSRLNEALNTKENKKENDRTKLFPQGKPRILTSDQFFAEVSESKRGREEEAAAKATRAVERENKKVSRAAADVAWKSQLEVHKLAVTAWEAKCVVLWGNGMKVKDLPKKPKRPVKPKATVEVESEPSSSDGELE